MYFFQSLFSDMFFLALYSFFLCLYLNFLSFPLFTLILPLFLSSTFFFFPFFFIGVYADMWMKLRYFTVNINFQVECSLRQILQFPLLINLLRKSEMLWSTLFLLLCLNYVHLCIWKLSLCNNAMKCINCHSLYF